MAVTAYWYGKAFLAAFNKEIDLVSDTMVAALCTSSYTPDRDTHDYASDLTNELSGGGYSRVTLAGKVVAYDSGTNVFSFDCDDVLFSGITATNVRYLALIDAQTGADATNPLVAYMDFGSNYSPSAQDILVQINAAGAFKVTVS